MNSVSRVKAICKERKIPVYKLERDLGYANGYVGQLKKGTFPDARLVEIARYLGVTPDFLLTGEENGKMPTPETEDGRNEVRFLGRDGRLVVRRLSDEQMAALEAVISQFPEADDL